MKRGILCRGTIKAMVKVAAAAVGKVAAVAHGDKAVAVASRQTWKSYCARGRTASKARYQAAFGAVEAFFWSFWYCWLPGDSRASTGSVRTSRAWSYALGNT